jgi:uncharacterized protein (TIGR03000 family)
LNCYGAAAYTPVGPGPEQIPPPKVEDKAGASLDRARVTFALPAGAKLFIDDQLMKGSVERRTFNTPRLERGQTYFYEVRAEVNRDGKTQTETKKVLVRAGENITVSFGTLEAPAVTTAGLSAAR